MSILEIPTARVFVPLLKPSRYKGAWGGRGSGKSHFFADRVVEECIARPGLRVVCIREVQKTLEQSVKRLIEDKLETYNPPGFEVLRSEIKTPGGGLIIFMGMQDHTAASIKSLEGFDIAWVEEAQSLSQRSLDLLRPTIRKPGSEIWFSWNPENEADAVDKFLRGPNAPSDAVVVRANWSDNPWLPNELRAEMELDRADSDKFGWVWEGQYRKAVEGAYYANQLLTAEKDGRIVRLSADPLLSFKAIWDIGSTSRDADATAIWIAQWVNREIRWLDYYEAKGQELSFHVNWLRANGYGEAECILPHDGRQHDKVYQITYESALNEAGFRTRTLPSPPGAAMQRIEAARRLFPRMWFDDDKTKSGRVALAAYHEKRDEIRNIGLGPNHDWASHGADAFGLGCIAYEEPSANGWNLPLRRSIAGVI